VGYSETVVFQRTELGREEIYNKKKGLTQSERLVLIMVDGTSAYAQLQVKLKSLVKARIERALHTLIDKGLILEVLFADVSYQQPEVEKAVVDKFLLQEAFDPVTVMSFDPEEDYGGSSTDSASTPQPKTPEKTSPPVLSEQLTAVAPQIEETTVLDELLEDLVNRPSVAKPEKKETKLSDVELSFQATLKMTTNGFPTPIASESSGIDYNLLITSSIESLERKRPRGSKLNQKKDGGFEGKIGRHGLWLLALGIILLSMPYLSKLLGD
jgi:hypothetical protein